MRGKRAIQREIAPDHVYGDVQVSKFINCLMLEGKKQIAHKIFYGAMENLKKEGEPLEIFKKALENVSPQVEVRSRRVGGATYQVPMEIRPKRSSQKGILALIRSARKRSGKSMIMKLYNEILDAFSQRGEAFKSKENTHKMAEANRAYSHYRW